MTLDRMAVVYDPLAPDRGRWLVGLAAVEVDVETTRCVPAEALEGKLSRRDRFGSWRGSFGRGRQYEPASGPKGALSVDGAVAAGSGS